MRWRRRHVKGEGWRWECTKNWRFNQNFIEKQFWVSERRCHETLICVFIAQNDGRTSADLYLVFEIKFFSLRRFLHSQKSQETFWMYMRQLDKEGDPVLFPVLLLNIFPYRFMASFMERFMPCICLMGGGIINSGIIWAVIFTHGPYYGRGR